MEQSRLLEIAGRFHTTGTIETASPLGNGLINDTFLVSTREENQPDYVLQCINHNVFKDVALLQSNIEKVTHHIRMKLQAEGESDIDRKVLRFMKAESGKTFVQEADGKYWRLSVFIPRSHTYNLVNPDYARHAGKAFGHFEATLSDLTEPLGETIPDFHNMELRLRQLADAARNDDKQRKREVADLLQIVEENARDMCWAEEMFRAGLLPKRICHCDTKVNNMLFDDEGRVLCVIDLDTVMPAFVFSDYGDFLRTAASTTAEDDPDTSNVAFRMDIFEAFSDGYLAATESFLQPVERENLPYAARMFPFMQGVRFLTDYLNGDVYYKITHETHNLERAYNQFQLYKSASENEQRMSHFIRG